MDQLNGYISENYDNPLVWAYSGHCSRRYMYKSDNNYNDINAIVLYKKHTVNHIDLLFFYEYGDYDYGSFDYFGHTADILETAEFNDKSFVTFTEILEKYGFGSCVCICDATNHNDEYFTYKMNNDTYCCNSDDINIKTIKNNTYYCEISDNLQFVNDDVKNDFVCENHHVH
jgi:hypothetical protein